MALARDIKGNFTSIQRNKETSPANIQALCFLWKFPGGSAVKNSPAMQETWVQFLGLADPLEKEMATHSSILAWEIMWAEEPSGLQSMGF